MPENILKFNSFTKGPSMFILEENGNKNPRSDDSAFSSQGHSLFFTEALNSLDSLFSIVLSVEEDENNKQKEILKYSNALKSLATKADGTLEGIKEVWDNIQILASNMLPSSKKKIEGSGPILTLRKEVNDLKAKKDAGDITEEEFKELLSTAKKDAIEASKMDPSIINLNDYAQASKLFDQSISKFKSGAFKELERVKGASEEDKDFYLSQISDSIKGVLRKERSVETTKGKATKRRSEEKEKASAEDKKGSGDIQSLIKSKGGSTGDNKPAETIREKRLVEDFGGFLQSAGGFLTGVKQGLKGAVDKTVFGSNPKDEITANTLISAAESLKFSVMAIATEIDNVIAFEKNITNELGSGTSQREISAKEDAKAMSDFLREVFKYVLPENIKTEIKSQPLSKIKKKIDTYSKDLQIMVRPGGQLDQFKDRVMGKKRESVIATGFLDAGLKLQGEAKGVLAKITDRKYLLDRTKEREPGNLIGSAVKALTGKKEEGPKETLIKTKKPKDYQTFPDNPTAKDKDKIKEFQDRLQKMKYLSGSFKGGEYDQQTKDASGRAMAYISSITGKTYGNTGDAFKVFQQDFSFYSDNEDVIRKNIGVK
jgi:hypothetical protein